VFPDELDMIGLSEALRQATMRAIEAIRVPYHEIIIDGTINFLRDTAKGAYVTVLAKGDQLVPAISAASIIAKVARDAYMEEQDAVYQGYGFAAHVGYGTVAHRQAIEKLGVTPLHRRSFAPIAAMTGTTKLVGDAAEAAVATFLVSAGHRVKARNWRTRFCEIDIVSEKDGTTYFTEVKYRRNDHQGGGIAAITPAKLRQMRLAADFYVARHPEADTATLAIASVTGNGRITDFLEVE
jgi:ribonuclease HII